MSEKLQNPKMRLEWKGKEIADALAKHMVQNLYRAAATLTNMVKENLSEPTSSSGPSQPGEFPHANTGLVRNSIFFQVDEEKLTGIVGTQSIVGLWLEHGLVEGYGITEIFPTDAQYLSWIDSASGERMFAKSVRAIMRRSFLRRTLDENRKEMKAILTRKLGKQASVQFASKSESGPAKEEG